MKNSGLGDLKQNSRICIYAWDIEADLEVCIFACMYHLLPEHI